MIETVDRSDLNEKIVGYAYFPLFSSYEDDRVPPYDDNTELFHFNQGAF